jgi:transcriptional regulator with XRE-family HTH domain
MGNPRRRPRYLAKKLKQIRMALGLSQSELVKHLSVDVRPHDISAYERDKREPPLHVLLAYARAADVWLAEIVDDKVKLKLKRK